MPRIALATCAALPELDPDEQLLLEPLRALGIDAQPAVWDDAAVDWAAFDLVVIRSTWDYTERRDAFVAWARSVPRLANPADIVEWNTDKHYLADLAAAGVPIVPTTWLSARPITLPASGMHVLKPAIGAGSVDAARYSMHDEHEARLAHEHVERLLAAGQTVMVQPYLDLIEERGETALIFFGGVFSHAVTKGAMLAADRAMVEGLYKEETIAPHVASAAEFEIGRAALAAVPGGGDRLVYARVDLVPDVNGSPVLIELELTEPSLFIGTDGESLRRFASAVAAGQRAEGRRNRK